MMFTFKSKQMKKIRFKLYAPLTAIALIAGTLGMSSCTKEFEKYNTDNTGLSEEDLKADFNFIGGFFPQIQSSIYFNFGNTTADFQLQQNLNADAYSGYLTAPHDFQSNQNNMSYKMIDGWNNSTFNLAYNNVMAPIYEIKRRGAQTIAPDFWAVALVLKVEAMHRVTDVYGPIPYSSFGSGGTTSSYDAQSVIYDRFFKELDTANTTLTAFVKANPSLTPFAKFDMIYGGDYKQWIKFANSLRLRLAIRIAKVDPARAKAEGEKALANAGGLLETNRDNVKVSGFGLRHPLFTIITAWSDCSMGASIESFMVGYKDPRISKYFDHATSYAGTYKGIRIGSYITPKPDYTGYSVPAVSETKTFTNNTPIQLMVAAEIYFLRAEAAIRGWANPGGTAEQLYEKGVSISMGQWDADAGAISSYLADNTSKPIAYVDPRNSVNNAAATTDLTIKWDEAAPFERKLERIITQKWISGFPEGQEAWSEFRRTGYPKLFTVVNNNSGGLVNTAIQIRRLPFPNTEYTSNKGEVDKAVTLLGGPDNAGTRLWWDKP